MTIQSAGSAGARTGDGPAARAVPWGAQVRALLADAARDPERPTLVDAIGPVTVGRLAEDVSRAARRLQRAPGAASGGFRIVAAPGGRHFVKEALATLLAGRIPVLAPPHAATDVAGMLAGATGTCPAWKVALDALDGRLTALGTCGGPPLGDTRLLAALGLRAGDRALIARPLYEPLAFEIAVRLILTGGTAILAAPFDSDHWLRQCATLNPDWALITPSQLAAVLGVADTTLGGTANLRTLMIDGQAPVSLRAAARQALPGRRLIQYFGTPLYYGATAESADLGGVSPEHRVLPGAALRIADADDGEAEDGQVALIQGRAHTHPVAAPCPQPDDWAAWGERGALTPRGRLIVTGTDIPGRAVVDGVAIAPARVRDKLAAHPAVTAVEVTAATDQFGGHRLSARVHTTNPALHEAALQAWCAAHLDSAERPVDLSLGRGGDL